MKKAKPVYLIKRLISNKISEKELETLLEGMDDEETTKVYEAYLQNHFNKIMDEHALKAKKTKTINK